MPKTIIASLTDPDPRKAQWLQVVVDESVLDEIRLNISDGSSILWENILPPQDDFVVFNKDIQRLQYEISPVISNMQTPRNNVSRSAKVFLYVLDSLCNACLNTGCSLFGYAD